MLAGALLVCNPAPSRFGIKMRVKGGPSSLRNPLSPPFSCVTREISIQPGHFKWLCFCFSHVCFFFKKRGTHLLGCLEHNIKNVFISCVFLCSFSFLYKFRIWLLSSFPIPTPPPISLCWYPGIPAFVPSNVWWQSLQIFWRDKSVTCFFFSFVLSMPFFRLPFVFFFLCFSPFQMNTGFFIYTFGERTRTYFFPCLSCFYFSLTD